MSALVLNMLARITEYNTLRCDGSDVFYALKQSKFLDVKAISLLKADLIRNAVNPVSAFIVLSSTSLLSRPHS